MKQPQLRQILQSKIRSHNGEAESLIYETADCNSYDLCDGGLPFHEPKPDLILDLGANVGVFVVAARAAFGDQVPIIAVEPSTEAFGHLGINVTGVPNLEIRNVGIGDGRPLAMVTSGGSLGTCCWANNGTLTGPPSKRLSELQGIDWAKNVLVKLDCEGGETAIYGHSPSEDCLRRAWAVIGELHYGHRFNKSTYDYWAGWIKGVLMDTHDIVTLYNSQPGRDHTTMSGNVQITAIRKDVKPPLC